jgi:hypothetical protein
LTSNAKALQKARAINNAILLYCFLCLGAGLAGYLYSYTSRLSIPESKRKMLSWLVPVCTILAASLFFAYLLALTDFKEHFSYGILALVALALATCGIGLTTGGLLWMMKHYDL